MRNAHVWDTWRHHNSYLDAKMGSVEWITPSTLAIPVMRNSTRMKHVAHLVWLYKKVSLTWSKVLEVSKIKHRFLCHLKNPKFPLGPLDLGHSLTIQRIFKIQSILANFIVNHVISINLITPVHTDALVPTMTTPPEIIPYYRLNHSIWSLSDNKEVSRWVLPGQRPVNHLTS
jgi:hypothetical protein